LTFGIARGVSVAVSIAMHELDAELRGDFLTECGSALDQPGPLACSGYSSGDPP
jgi:hypothetical protein